MWLVDEDAIEGVLGVWVFWLLFDCISWAYILLDGICMISIAYFSHFFNFQSFSLFQCLSTMHFEAFGNNNHIWSTSPGLSLCQAWGFDKCSIRPGSGFWKPKLTKARPDTSLHATTTANMWEYNPANKFVRKYACCINPLSDLAYANVFVQKLQPFAYAGYVTGC